MVEAVRTIIPPPSDQENQSVLQEKLQSESECTHDAHYWLIERPNGPTSLGTCKHCGAVREFRNGAVDFLLD